MIVKLHGTSGSGKSTVAHDIIKTALPVTTCSIRGKIVAYETHLPNVMEPLFIIGPYKTQCGGMDAISSVDDQIWLIEEYARAGHVFYEGLLCSEYYGRLGKASEKYGDDHLFAFLDTPISICIDRIKQRRLDAGNVKVFDETNTRNRVKKIERLRHRLDFEFKRKTVTVPHLNATNFVVGLYGP